MDCCTASLKIVILSREFYPDVKRGGAVFARKLYDLLRQYTKHVAVITMFWSINVKGRDDHVYALRIPKGILRLFLLPLYVLFAMHIIRKGEYQFIISNGVYEALIPMILNKPFAIIIHDDAPFTIGLLSKVIISVVLRRASLVICPSYTTARIVRTYANVNSEDRVIVLHNFIENRELELIRKVRGEILYRLYPRLKMLRNYKKILFIGKVSEHKGFPALLKAIKMLKENGYQVLLLVIGPELSYREDLENGVIYLGEVGDIIKIACLKEADVFVLPSVAHEGFGIAVIEAMAVGKPLVLGNVTAFREVAGDAALFVNGRNPQSIYDTLKRLFEDAYLRKKLALEGSKRIYLFSEKRASKQCLELMEYIMKILKNTKK